MKTVPLGELVTITIGKTPPRGDHTFWDRDKIGKNAWLSIRDLQILDGRKVLDSSEYISDKGAGLFKPVPKGTLLASFKLTLGRLAFAGRDIYTNEAIAALHNDEKTIINEYLYYYLSYFDWYLYAKSDMKVKGLTLNKAKLNLLPVSFPESIDEQRRIVKVLEKIFEKIDNAIGLTSRNLKNARELFESKLSEVIDGSSPEEVRLSDITESITDGDHMPPPKTDQGIPFITISNINKDTHEIDFSNTFKVSRTYFDNIKQNRKPEEGDLLYTVTGSYGIPVLVSDAREFCFQRHIALIKPGPEMNSEWLYYWMISSGYKQAQDVATGTAQKTVSLTDLRNFMIPRVPLTQQLDDVAKLRILREEIKLLVEAYEKKMYMLKELKVSTLSKALKGEQ